MTTLEVIEEHIRRERPEITDVEGCARFVLRNIHRWTFDEMCGYYFRKS